MMLPSVVDRSTLPLQLSAAYVCVCMYLHLTMVDEEMPTRVSDDNDTHNSRPPFGVRERTANSYPPRWR